MSGRRLSTLVLAVLLGWGSFADSFGASGAPTIAEAEAAFAAGDTANAFRLFARILATDRKNVAAYLGRGRCRVLLRDVAGGEADFTQALKLDPNCVDAYVERARTHFQRDAWAAGIADCDRALDLDPALAEVRSDRGWAYLKLGDIEHAQTDLDQAIQAEPGLATAWLRRALLHREAGKLVAAMSDAHQAVELEPDRREALHLRAELAATLGMADTAEREFSRLIESNPKDVPAWIGRGDARRHRRKFAEANQDIQEALRLDPKSAQAYVMLGRIKFDLDDRSAAFAAYTRALDCDPNSADARVGRATLFYLAGMLSEAIGETDKALAIDRRHGMAYSTRAAARSDAGDYEGALADLAEVLALFSGDARAHLLVTRGDVRLRMGQFEQAIRDYEAAMRASPPSEFAGPRLVVATFAAGDHARAEHISKDLLKAVPTDELTRIDHALLLRHRGALKEALTEFDAVARANSLRAMRWWYITSCELNLENQSKPIFSQALQAWSKQHPDAWPLVLGEVLIGIRSIDQALEIAPGRNLHNRTYELSKVDVEIMNAYRLRLAGDTSAAVEALKAALARNNSLDLERFVHLRDLERWTRSEQN